MSTITQIPNKTSDLLQRFSEAIAKEEPNWDMLRATLPPDMVDSMQEQLRALRSTISGVRKDAAYFEGLAEQEGVVFGSAEGAYEPEY